MPTHYKAMLVVIFLTIGAFIISKPVFVRFMSEQDFDRRRNVWVALIAAAFLIQSYWSFAFVTACLLIYTTKKDSNPAALYLLLMLTIPPMTSNLSIPGVAGVVTSINHIRLLELFVLLPAALQIWSNRKSAHNQPVVNQLLIPDVLLMLYGFLQLALVVPFVSITVSIRAIFDLFAFTLIPYYAISRSCQTRERLTEMMASFVLAMIILVPLAIFEWKFHWILHQSLETRWTGGGSLGAVMRGGILRAAGPAGHPIVLGFALTIALGMWFYLKEHIAVRGWRWLGVVALVSALVVTYSRGPWVGAIAMIMTFAAIGPGGAKRTFQAFGYAALVSGVILISPYGDKVISYLPFVGTVDAGSVDYRQIVAAASWNVIKLHPFFGDFNYMSNLEELRTGLGIIDIVNSYAGIALSYGLVGLFLFVSFFASLAFLCYQSIRSVADTDPELVVLGRSLLACLISCMVTIATVSQYLSVPSIEIALGALMAGYVMIARRTYSSRTLNPITTVTSRTLPTVLGTVS